MKKSTKILVGALIVLGAIYAVQRLTSTTSTTESSKLFSGIDTSKVARISIDFGGEIVLARQGGKWAIVSPIHFPAAPGQVSLLLSRLASNPSATVVADNLSDTSAYGLGSSAPVLKIDQSGGRSTSLRIGNLTPDFNGCYVQLQGGNTVLQLSANIRTLAAQNLADWRDKKVFDFAASDVATIDFALGDTLYHFFHRDTVWQVNGKNIPGTEAQGVVGSLIGLRALGFVDSTVDMSKSLLDYGATLSNREHLTGKVFELAEPKGYPEQVYLSNSANNQIYIVSSMLPRNIEQELRGIYRSYLVKDTL